MPRVGVVVDSSYVTVAGEPVAGTTGTAGSGRGPLEKDLIAGTSPAAYRCDAASVDWNVATVLDAGPKVSLGASANTVGQGLAAGLRSLKPGGHSRTLHDTRPVPILSRRSNVGQAPIAPRASPYQPWRCLVSRVSWIVSVDGGVDGWLLGGSESSVGRGCQHPFGRDVDLRGDDRASLPSARHWRRHPALETSRRNLTVHYPDAAQSTSHPGAPDPPQRVGPAARRGPRPAVIVGLSAAGVMLTALIIAANAFTPSTRTASHAAPATGTTIAAATTPAFCNHGRLADGNCAADNSMPDLGSTDTAAADPATVPTNMADANELYRYLVAANLPCGPPATVANPSLADTLIDCGPSVVLATYASHDLAEHQYTVLTSFGSSIAVHIAIGGNWTVSADDVQYVQQAAAALGGEYRTNTPGT
jgi:hypothetical protein